RGLPIRLVWFPWLFCRLLREKPQVIISEGLTNIINNIATWLYCKLFSVPLIIWDGGRKKDNPMGRVRKLVEIINRFLLKQAGAVIAYSSVAKDYFLSLGIAEERIFVAQNTVDIEKHLQEARHIESDPSKVSEVKKRLGLSGKRVLLYIGALEKWKKIDELICVFGELKKEIPDISLLIIGDGPEQQSLRSLAKQKEVDDCHFLGKITDGTGPYFALCDICVIPGRGGLAINQAMAYGKFVITGEADGTEKDLIKEGVNGFTIRNQVELKESLIKILSEKYSAIESKEYSDTIIGRFDLDNMAERFSEAIKYSKKKDCCRVLRKGRY
ncbi:MAG: glycosyltransferase, partial [Calditrichales bacterium]|nr:glycosyltransferase [Calditrichales bacterium]